MNTALFSGSDLDVVFSLVLTMSLSASWIAAAVLVGIFFVYPFVCDLSAGVDPWARYQPKVEA